MHLVIILASTYLLGALLFIGRRSDYLFENRVWASLRASAPEWTERRARAAAIAILVGITALWPVLLLITVLDFFIGWTVGAPEKIETGSLVRVEGVTMRVNVIQVRHDSAGGHTGYLRCASDGHSRHSDPTTTTR
jgi:hypothetical protein